MGEEKGVKGGRGLAHTVDGLERERVYYTLGQSPTNLLFVLVVRGTTHSTRATTTSKTRWGLSHLFYAEGRELPSLT